MNGWQQKTYISLEHGEPFSCSHYELLPLKTGNNGIDGIEEKKPKPKLCQQLASE